MKEQLGKHARNLSISSLLVPVALALATFVANEAQMLIGLHLDRVSLALYLLPFLAATAAAIIALIKLEANKAANELGGLLKGMLFAGAPEASAPKAKTVEGAAVAKAADVLGGTTEPPPPAPPGEPPKPARGLEGHRDPEGPAGVNP